MNPSCTGSSLPSTSRPSTVRTLVPGRHRRQHGAGLHRFAVDVDDAGAAVAGVTAPVSSGEPQLIPQEVHEQHARLDSAVTCSPLTVMVTCMVSSLPALRIARPRCAGFGWSARRPGGACTRRCRACRVTGSQACGGAPARLGEGLLGRRARRPARPTPRPAPPASALTAVRPTRAAAIDPSSSVTAAPAAATAQSPTRRSTFA